MMIKKKQKDGINKDLATVRPWQNHKVKNGKLVDDEDTENLKNTRLFQSDRPEKGII